MSILNQIKIYLQKKAFYLFRFLDEAFIQLPDLTNTTEDFLMKTLCVNANPNIHMFEGRLANYFESSNLDFGLVMLNMTNNIYATHEQAEFLRIAKKSCNINVSYLPVTLSQIPHDKYGFSNNTKETFYIVDFRENPQKKFVYDGDFSTIDEI